jgi:hypothetical protein
LRTADVLVAFSLNLDTEMLSEALEADVGGVFLFAVLGVGKLRETISGNVLGAYNARFAVNCGSLSSRWGGFNVFDIIFAFTLDAECCCWY